MELKYKYGFYESRNLTQLLRKIPLKNIRKFEDSAIDGFIKYERDIIKNSIIFDTEGIEMDKRLGFYINMNEYKNAKKKIEKRKTRIEKEAIKYINENLKFFFFPGHPTLLTQVREEITRTGWFLNTRGLFAEAPEKYLQYNGKNFDCYGQKSCLVKLWKSILSDYFKLLEKYD